MHKQGFYEKFIKRPLDFLLALIAVVLLSPVLLVTAVLVRLKLGSPVLFRQERPGRYGRIFRLIKFRTMTDARSADGTLLPDADRLTPFGRKLRATSLDELPELFNVLRGDMSLVGPRPLLVRYLPRYHGRNAISWEEKFDWDVKYVDHVTFLGDCRILLATVKTVFSHEGISSGTSATMEEFMGTPEPEQPQIARHGEAQ